MAEPNALWDEVRPEQDLVVLVGPRAVAAQGACAARGVRRAVGVRGVDESSTQRLLDHLDRDLPGSAPRRVWVWADAGLPRERVQELTRRTSETIRLRRDRERTADQMGALWHTHELANARAVIRTPTLSAIRGIRGRPLVIAGAGPSLPAAAQILADRGGGAAVVLAVSHAYRPLAAAGVCPDLVMALDAQDTRYHLRDVEPPRALALSTVAHPAMMCAPARARVVYIGTTLSWYGPPTSTVPSGGSVVTSALELGRLWGCAPIILIGCDLSYPEGRVYAQGTGDEGMRYVVADDGQARVTGTSAQVRELELSGHGDRDRLGPERTLPGYHGGRVPTSPALAGYHAWTERWIREHNVRVINATGGGAAIAGAEQQPLDEALSAWCQGGAAGLAIPTEATPDYAGAVRASLSDAGRRAEALARASQRYLRARRYGRVRPSHAHDVADLAASLPALWPPAQPTLRAAHAALDRSSETLWDALGASVEALCARAEQAAAALREATS